MTAAVATLAALLVASIAAVAVLVVTRPKKKLSGLMTMSGPGAPPGGTMVLVTAVGHAATKGLEPPAVPAGTKLVGEVFIAGIEKGSVMFVDKAMYTGKPSGTPTTVLLYSARGGYLIYVPSVGWIQPSSGTNIVADPAKAEVFQLAPIAQ